MNCPFKKFKFIFGKEGQGVHSLRIFNIAIIDVLLTIIAAIIITYFTKLNFWIILFILFILGILFHRIFCVNTTINMIIFGKL